MSFYERFVSLCEQKGVKPSRAAAECDINRSNVTSWKNNGYTPRGDVLQRIASYFGVSVGYLLGEETEKAPTADGERSVSHDEIKFALFRGREDITDAMYQEVLNFAEYVARREEEKKKKE